MLLQRPRRNRKSAAVRALVQETFLSPADFIAPFFLIAGTKLRQEIAALPGVYRLSIDLILKEVESLHKKGISSIMLFPSLSSDEKDERASAALREDSPLCQAITTIKRELPALCVITDIALDPYTTHGHDGVIDARGEVANDETVAILCQMALLHAACGVDIVAPSDMMDGRIRAMRESLERAHFPHVNILSYAIKYASHLYLPFRNAVGSHLKFGDKKGYQLNPANKREALLEAKLDEEEGADILMVKPALFYLDVIAEIRKQSTLPICAYHVSGEYAMVMAAEEKGYLKAQDIFYESLMSIKRAGADCMITYALPKILSLL